MQSKDSGNYVSLLNKNEVIIGSIIHLILDVIVGQIIGGGSKHCSMQVLPLILRRDSLIIIESLQL